MRSHPLHDSGNMNINKLSDLVPVTVDEEDSTENQSRAANSFVLDASPNTSGKVVLYYKTKNEPQVCEFAVFLVGCIFICESPCHMRPCFVHGGTLERVGTCGRLGSR